MLTEQEKMTIVEIVYKNSHCNDALIQEFGHYLNKRRVPTGLVSMVRALKDICRDVSLPENIRAKLDEIFSFSIF